MIHSGIATVYKVPEPDDKSASETSGDQFMADDGDIEMSHDQIAPFSFRFSSYVAQSHDGTLNVTVTWVIPDWLAGIETNDVRQTILWAKQSCDPSMEHQSCGDDYILHKVIKNTRNSVLNVSIIPTLNSKNILKPVTH